MAKAQIAIQGSLRGTKKGEWDNVTTLEKRRAVLACDNLSIFCNSGITVEEAVEALEKVREAYPEFRGNIDEDGKTEKGTPIVKLWREPNGTPLDVLLGLE